MSKKSTDIDALVGKDQLELTIGGKTYYVKDVPLELFLQTASEEEQTQDPKLLHRQLAQLFGVDVDELTHIGFRSAALAIREIRDWLFEESGIPIEGAGSDESANP